MAGWLVLTFAEDENGDQAEEKYLSLGEARLDCASSPNQTFTFGEPGGVVGVEWFAPEPDEEGNDEGPELKGKTRAELAADAEAKAAKDAEAEAAPAKATASSK